jgi:hypothetical protein
MSDKVVTDGPAVHPGQSTRTLEFLFTELGTFDFFRFPKSGRSRLRLDSSSLVLDGILPSFR